MRIFETTATGRALRDGTRAVVRYALPVIGATFLVVIAANKMSGICLLPGSVACSF